MKEIATSDRQVTIFYNADSTRAKKTLAFAKTQKLPIREIDILSTPLTGTQLLEIADALNLNIEDMVNQEHPYFKTHFGHVNFSTIDWLKMIEQNPRILKQPIAMLGDDIVLVETPTDVLRLFSRNKRPSTGST